MYNYSNSQSLPPPPSHTGTIKSRVQFNFGGDQETSPPVAVFMNSRFAFCTTGNEKQKGAATEPETHREPQRYSARQTDERLFFLRAHSCSPKSPPHYFHHLFKLQGRNSVLI